MAELKDHSDRLESYQRGDKRWGWRLVSTRTWSRPTTTKVTRTGLLHG